MYNAKLTMYNEQGKNKKDKKLKLETQNPKLKNHSSQPLTPCHLSPVTRPISPMT